MLTFRLAPCLYAAFAGRKEHGLRILVREGHARGSDLRASSRSARLPWKLRHFPRLPLTLRSKLNLGAAELLQLRSGDPPAPTSFASSFPPFLSSGATVVSRQQAQSTTDPIHPARRSLIRSSGVDSSSSRRRMAEAWSRSRVPALLDRVRRGGSRDGSMGDSGGARTRKGPGFRTAFPCDI